MSHSQASHPPTGHLSQRKHRSWQPVAALFHTAALAWYTFVWSWHFLSKRARFLPGFKGFGLYFRCGSVHWPLLLHTLQLSHITPCMVTCRYLTFYSYTLQLLQLIISFFTHVVQVRNPHVYASLYTMRGTICTRLTPLASFQDSANLAWVERGADDLSCAVFGLANVVRCNLPSPLPRR